MPWVVLGALIISFAPVFVRLLTLPPTVIGLYRMAFGLGVLFLWSVASRQRIRWSTRSSLLALAAGVFFALDVIFWHRSINLIGPGLATLLANCQVFFVTLFGLVILREKPSPRLGLAIPCAVLGLFLVVGPTLSNNPQAQAGIGLGALAAMSYAGYLLVLREAEKARPHLQQSAYSPVMFWATLGSLGVLGLVAGFEGVSLHVTRPQDWLLLLGYGVLVQGLAWVLISKGLPQIPISQGGLLLLLQPALALVWDVLFFHRPISLREVLGALLTLAAIYLGNQTPSAKGNPPKEPIGEAAVPTSSGLSSRQET